LLTTPRGEPQQISPQARGNGDTHLERSAPPSTKGPPKKNRSGKDPRREPLKERSGVPKDHRNTRNKKGGPTRKIYNPGKTVSL